VHPERRRHDDGFQIFPLEHLAPLDIMPGGRPTPLSEDFIRLRERERIDVAECAYVRVRRIGVVEQHASLRADGDEADFHRPAAHGTVEGSRRPERRKRGGAGQCLQEVAAADRLLFGGHMHAGILNYLSWGPTPTTCAFAPPGARRSCDNELLSPVSWGPHDLCLRASGARRYCDNELLSLHDNSNVVPV
jgi:hypothetical protein